MKRSRFHYLFVLILSRLLLLLFSLNEMLHCIIMVFNSINTILYVYTNYTILTSGMQIPFLPFSQLPPHPIVFITLFGSMKGILSSSRVCFWDLPSKAENTKATPGGAQETMKCWEIGQGPCACQHTPQSTELSP